MKFWDCLKWICDRLFGLACVATLDIAVGIFLAVLFAQIMGLVLDGRMVVWGALSALWLDIDAVLYWSPTVIGRIVEPIEQHVIGSKRLFKWLIKWADRWKKWIGEHRSILHHSWLVILVTAIFWKLAFAYFYIFVFLAGSFWHLIHDTFDYCGVKWGSPFNFQRWRIHLSWSGIDLQKTEASPEEEGTWLESVFAQPVNYFLAELIFAAVFFLITISLTAF